MGAYRPGGFTNLPPVVKNIVIINVLLFLATWYMESQGRDMVRILGLHYPESAYFGAWQFVTHMFMHGGFGHIFFNMFAFWMFGRVLENVWGGRRFLVYFFITGLGAAALHTAVIWWQVGEMKEAAAAFANTPTPDLFISFIRDYFPEFKGHVSKLLEHWRDNPDSAAYKKEAIQATRELIALKMNIPTVGASGAVYGVLLAFGVLFPNTIIYLYFAIPIKAKYFVMIFGALELWFGLSRPGDNIAHFAHLGGMVFGLLLLKIWQTNRNTFY